MDDQRLVVSIHAPVMGANAKGARHDLSMMRFNPRTRDGCEINIIGQQPFFSVSIHAPVMGANIRNILGRTKH